MKESDAQRLRRAGVLRDVCSFLLLAEVCGRERGTHVEENGPLSRSIEGWEEGFINLYLLLSLPLVSQLSVARVASVSVKRECESESGMKNRSSHSKLRVGDRNLLCCLLLAFRFITAGSRFRPSHPFSSLGGRHFHDSRSARPLPIPDTRIKIRTKIGVSSPPSSYR